LRDGAIPQANKGYLAEIARAVVEENRELYERLR